VEQSTKPSSQPLLEELIKQWNTNELTKLSTRPCHDSGHLWPASKLRGQGLFPNQSTWDLWWAKCQFERFSSKYLGFPLSVSFHQCSILIYSSTTNITANDTHQSKAGTTAHSPIHPAIDAMIPLINVLNNDGEGARNTHERDGHLWPILPQKICAEPQPRSQHWLFCKLHLHVCTVNIFKNWKIKILRNNMLTPFMWLKKYRNQ
jgi:hypothetical protein